MAALLNKFELPVKLLQFMGVKLKRLWNVGCYVANKIICINKFWRVGWSRVGELAMLRGEWECREAKSCAVEIYFSQHKNIFSQQRIINDTAGNSGHGITVKYN